MGLTAARPPLDRPAVRRARRARLLVQGDPDQARLRVASGRRGDAARAADAVLGAVLRRDGVVGGTRGRRRGRSRAATGARSSGSASSATTSRACSTSWASCTSPRRSSGSCCSSTRRWSCCCRRCCAGRPITRRAVAGARCSRTPASRSSSRTTCASAATRAALWTGGALVFASAFAYALYLVDAGAVIARLGSLRFIAWAMLVSSVFVLAQFALTRDLALLARAGVDLRAVARDGGLLDRAADVAHRRGDPPSRRQHVVADRLARPRVHDRAGRADPGRGGPLRSSSSARRWCSSASMLVTLQPPAHRDAAASALPEPDA